MCIRQCQTSLISSYLCLVSITPCFHLSFLVEPSIISQIPQIPEYSNIKASCWWEKNWTSGLSSSQRVPTPSVLLVWMFYTTQIRPLVQCLRVNQDHLHSIIPFAVDRTEPASAGSHDFTHSKPSVRQRPWTTFSENGKKRQNKYIFWD